MLINNTPALACDTKLHNDARKVIELALLEKFHVVEDLIVDRSVIFNNLKNCKSGLMKTQILRNKIGKTFLKLPVV
jgi:succinate dehydrogenase / fumarate reductase iron-sulfur subunit